ncbi:hypothetical protein SRHO_G00020810 [Serrasalmus rhombeus]
MLVVELSTVVQQIYPAFNQAVQNEMVLEQFLNALLLEKLRQHVQLATLTFKWRQRGQNSSWVGTRRRKWPLVMVGGLTQFHKLWLVPLQDAYILSLEFLKAAGAVLDLQKETLGLRMHNEMLCRMLEEPVPGKHVWLLLVPQSLRKMVRVSLFWRTNGEDAHGIGAQLPLSQCHVRARMHCYTKDTALRED